MQRTIRFDFFIAAVNKFMQDTYKYFLNNLHLYID